MECYWLLFRYHHYHEHVIQALSFQFIRIEMTRFCLKPNAWTYFSYAANSVRDAQEIDYRVYQAEILNRLLSEVSDICRREKLRTYRMRIYIIKYHQIDERG